MRVLRRASKAPLIWGQLVKSGQSGKEGLGVRRRGHRTFTVTFSGLSPECYSTLVSSNGSFLTLEATGGCVLRLLFTSELTVVVS